MKAYLTTTDYLIIIAYFISVLIIGFKTKSSENSIKEYLVAGRTLTLPAFVATLVSSFYGGILGIGEFTFIHGISGWFFYAFPYYVFIMIFAFFLADRIRKARLFTIPEKLDLIYGRKVSLLGAFMLFLLATPAPYVFIMGLLIKIITNLNITVCMIISVIISIIYLFKGGLKADVRVNILEFVVMFIGFGIMIPFCFNVLGDFEYVTERVPDNFLTLTGHSSLQYFFVWFFLGAWVLIDPVFHQRCYAAKKKNTPKFGVLISLVFWIIFDFMTTMVGLYSKAFFKDLTEPVLSFPALAESVLPPIVKGLFYLGMIATVMSSLHSYMFISATTFGTDIIAKLKSNQDDSNLYSRIGMAVSAILSILIAILIPSVVSIWYTIGTLIVPPLLISVVSSYFTRLQVHSKYIFASMVASFSLSLFSFVMGEILKVGGRPRYFLGVEPMYPGLVLGLIIYIIGLINRKNLKPAREY